MGFQNYQIGKTIEASQYWMFARILIFSFTADKRVYLKNNFGKIVTLPKKFEHSCVLQPKPPPDLYSKETHKHEYQKITY